MREHYIDAIVCKRHNVIISGMELNLEIQAMHGIQLVVDCPRCNQRSCIFQEIPGKSMDGAVYEKMCVNDNCKGYWLQSKYWEIDMYDTDMKKAFPYGNHKWTLLPNSKGINVIKCQKCKIARLYLVGHDLIHCK